MNASVTLSAAKAALAARAPGITLRKAEAAPAASEADKPGREYIDMTPTWAAMAGTFRLVIENGNAEGRESMWQEIGRALALADERNAMAKRLAAVESVLAGTESDFAMLRAIRAAVAA